MKNIKNKTCITILKTDLPNKGEFTEYINIPHKVDIIRCNNMGFHVVDGGGNIEAFSYYIVSDLISNIHDTILGVGPNINYYFPSSQKEFSYNSVSVNGSFNFKIYELSTGIINTNTISLFIDLEFIELDKS